MIMTSTTAIIGGGIAGITASRLLSGVVGLQGNSVALFERSTRLGGRVSSRTVNDSFVWVYGYQQLGLYPNPHLPPGGTRVLEGKERIDAVALLGRDSREDVVVADSPLRGLDVPDDVDVRTGCNVVGLRRTSEKRWGVTFEQHAGRHEATFDRVVIADYTAATSLLRQVLSTALDPPSLEAVQSITDRLDGVEYRPVFAYLAHLHGDMSEEPITSNAFSMLRQEHSFVWGFTSPEMTARLLRELPMTDAHGRVVPQAKEYRSQVASILDETVGGASRVRESWSHRWGRGFPTKTINDTKFLYDERLRLGVCGDMFAVDGLAPFDSAEKSAEALVGAMTTAAKL